MSGLTNFGNTCYLNSVVQVLRYTKPVVKPLVDVRPEDNTCNLFLDLLYQGSDATNFAKRLSELGFDPILQHDAHEFFMTMLDKLYSNIKKKNPFEGTYISTLTCGKCCHTSVSKEPFVSVSICSDIKSSLEKMRQSEVVQCRCEKCGESKMKKTVRIDLGEAVCFHIKRFDHNLKKLRFKIPLLQTWNGYCLVGMINHVGSVYGGHYTASVKTDSGWVVANDEHIRSIDSVPQTSSLPYLLVYSRCK